MKINSPLNINEYNKEENALFDRVRQIAYEIHGYHEQCHLEKIYENALVNRLIKAGIKVNQQYPLTVFDEDGTVLGEYIADLFAEEKLIIELKAAKTITPEREAQILGYLISSKIKHGLLINFGSYKFELKKYAM